MRRLAILMLALALLTVGRDAAEARRIKFLSALPIEPQRERVVRVRELPDVAAFKMRDGGFFDLGYLMRTDGTGEWVGYVGSETSYIPLGPQSISFIMEHAGLAELPPLPKAPSGFPGAAEAEHIDPRLLGFLLAPVLLVIGAVRFLRRRPRVKIALPQPAAAEPAAGGKDWVKRAHASVNAAAPPIESPIIRAARERAERLRQQAPAVRGQIAKSPEISNRPDFGRLGGRR